MREDDEFAEADFTDASATFGDRVTAAREALGLTVAGLARHLGVKPETVRAWEGDQSEPRPNKLQMLAGVLNVSLVWLMSGRGPGPRTNAPAAALPPEMLAELRAIRAAQADLSERLQRLLRRIEGGA